MKKLWDLKKGFSNLELEGQRHGIIMGVAGLLLLGPFYYKQTNFLYFFAHDCKLTIFDVHKFPVEVMKAKVSIIIFHQDVIYFSDSDSYFVCVIVYFLRNRKHLISHSVLDSHSIILFILPFSYSPQTQVFLISVTIL